MPTVIQRGLEIVPGYTLVRRLGSGMSGEVWVARASGGVHVAIKLIKDLSQIGSKRELGALRIVREIKHPNLCPLIGVWFIDHQGELLSSSETDEILGRESSLIDTACLQTMQPPLPEERDSGFSAGKANPDTETQAWQIGDVTPGPSFDPSTGIHSGAGRTSLPTGTGPLVNASDPARSREDSIFDRAGAMVVAMGLGEKTLHDRLLEMRAPGNQPAAGTPPIEQMPGGLPIDELMRYLIASASAIDELNTKYQIFHCDIKPQNILVVGGHAQVCDFGLARQVPDSRQTQLAIGTPAYGAPEMIFDHTYSRTIDQYSLAITYYELRTGQLPFETNRRSSFLRLKASGELDLTLVSAPERMVMERATQLDPELRYSTCTEFAMALAAGIEQQRYPVASQSTQSSWKMIAAASVLAVIGVGVTATQFMPTLATLMTQRESSAKEKVGQGVGGGKDSPPVPLPEAGRGEPEGLGPLPPDPNPVTTNPEPTTPPPVVPDPLPQRKLEFSGDTSATAAVQLALASETLRQWIDDPKADRDRASIERFLAHVREQLPLPSLIDPMTQPSDQAIAASTLRELAKTLGSLGAVITPMKQSTLEAGLDVTRLQIDALLNRQDRDASLVQSVRSWFDQESNPLGELAPQAAWLLVAPVQALVSFDAIGGDGRAESSNWVSLADDLDLADPISIKQPALADQLRQRRAIELVRLESRRRAVDSPLDPALAEDLDAIARRWLDTLRQPIGNGKPAIDLLPEPLRTQTRLIAGRTSWEDGDVRTALATWISATESTDAVDRVDDSLRSEIANELLTWLRESSGVADHDVSRIRYADQLSRAAGVLTLARKIAPSDDEVILARWWTDGLLVDLAEEDDVSALVALGRPLVPPADWSPQVNAAVYATALKKGHQSIGWLAWLLKTADLGGADEAGARQERLHAALEVLKQAGRTNSDGTYIAPEAIDDTALVEFARLVLKPYRGPKGTVLPSFALQYWGDIELAASVLAERTDDAPERSEACLIASEAYLQARTSLQDEVPPQTLLAKLIHYQELGSRGQTDTAAADFLLGRLSDLEGFLDQDVIRSKKLYEESAEHYNAALDHDATTDDLRGELLRCRAELKLRQAALMEISDRSPLVESALADALQAIDLPPRWFNDNDQRLETAADAVWKQITWSPNLSVARRNELLDQFDTLLDQALTLRDEASPSRGLLLAKRLDGYWQAMLNNRVEDLKRYRDRRIAALRLLDANLSPVPTVIEGVTSTQSIATTSDHVQCQWHRSVARLMESLDRHDEALASGEMARQIAAKRLIHNQSLQHATTLEWVVLRGRTVSSSSDAANQALIAELIEALQTIRYAQPEIGRQRDRLLGELRGLKAK